MIIVVEQTQLRMELAYVPQPAPHWVIGAIHRKEKQS